MRKEGAADGYDVFFSRCNHGTTILKCKKIKTDKGHEPFVRMSAHSASSIDITVRVWCKTADYWDVYFDIIEFIREQFIEDHIEIPYQQIDVHMKNK